MAAKKPSNIKAPSKKVSKKAGLARGRRIPMLEASLLTPMQVVARYAQSLDLGSPGIGKQMDDEAAEWAKRTAISATVGGLLSHHAHDVFVSKGLLGVMNTDYHFNLYGFNALLNDVTRVLAPTYHFVRESAFDAAAIKKNGFQLVGAIESRTT